MGDKVEKRRYGTLVGTANIGFEVDSKRLGCHGILHEARTGPPQRCQDSRESGRNVNFPSLVAGASGAGTGEQGNGGVFPNPSCHCPALHWATLDTPIARCQTTPVPGLEVRPSTGSEREDALGFPGNNFGEDFSWQA